MSTSRFRFLFIPYLTAERKQKLAMERSILSYEDEKRLSVSSQESPRAKLAEQAG